MGYINEYGDYRPTEEDCRRLEGERDRLLARLKDEIAFLRREAARSEKRWGDPRLRTEVRASERGRQIVTISVADRLEALLVGCSGTER